MKTKLIVFMICMLGFNASSKSQVIISLLFGDKLNSDKISFGLMLGGSWSYLNDYKTSSSLRTFNLGLYLSWMLDKKWFLQFDALAKYKLGAKGLPVYSLHDEGLDSLFAPGHVERDIKYVGLITTIQYRVFNYVNIELGPQITLRMKAKDIFYTDRSGGDLKFEKNISSASTLFDIGAVAGISYQLKGNGIKIGARYYAGFIDVFPDDVGNNHNSSIQLSGYIPIGRKKALLKQQKKKQQQSTLEPVN